MNSKLTFSESLKAGLWAGLAAAVANAALYFMLHAAGVIADAIPVKPNQPLTVVPVLFASLIPALVAAVVFFGIEKYTQNGFRIFTIVAVVLGALSMASPFTIPGITVGYALVLCLMHVVAIAALLFFIGRSVKSNNQMRTAFAV